MMAVSAFQSPTMTALITLALSALLVRLAAGWVLRR